MSYVYVTDTIFLVLLTKSAQLQPSTSCQMEVIRLFPMSDFLTPKTPRCSAFGAYPTLITCHALAG